ncbi:MAG: hypothetical protein A2023_05285 [Sulfuricurvum sp. GWF2_44_89]|uniref:Uncharacterized protein n=1 Tax=Sulfuricurvum kujiense TaxID=148813 RepID=A0A2D3WMN5_9BACT|nr:MULTISPECIES: hypothetical protein [Sulfuricurvum]OHD77551.1 MAG: hypothetical protein A2023_05285 [Sulfuricurvum sp. GWF2_44_89]OHD92250.1 MAG: hypothetical protein A2552_04990 [Sulfuricurvum sp. RIFOXYD2_FULL_44_160]OHD96346.1 MAG: hypothetical protein A2517_06870 [Sulfuricurvum sp. RIFOXYD12_FULL_44_77]DAB38409.1 MAG TPA: hypothetical protein CFH83_06060 [Sulfuricurvum kujiense]
MSRLVIFLLVGVTLLESAAWRESKTFNLKKDELVKVLVKSEGQERLLNFRWTLYADKALVVHESFDRFVGQHVLYVGHVNQSFRKVLLSAKRTQKDVPYIIVVFKKFDEGNNTAQMDLLLIDKENRIVLDYLTKK